MKISETLQKSSPFTPQREMSKTEYMKLVDANTELVDKMKDIQERIDKAIEYIKEHGVYGFNKEYQELLNILKGEDKE